MNGEKIRITEEDLRAVKETPVAPIISHGGTTREWGTIGEPGSELAGESKGWGRFFLKSWVYLPLAGALGAFVGWAAVEPSFEDYPDEINWARVMIIPIVVVTMCIGFALAESVVERSVAKILRRGLIAIPLGLGIGIICALTGGMVFGLGKEVAAETALGATVNNPVFWVARSVAWTFLGAAGGLVYGILGRSWKQTGFGLLGGVLGGALGGLLFDPISLLVDGAEASRCIGMTAVAITTGVGIGLVESALKNRWLYVSGGPLAGKQFIIYKKLTRIGSQQTNDLYLFKDTSILPLHASIELRGDAAIFRAAGPAFIGGVPAKNQALRSGDLIQIGRYSIQYKEKKS